MLAKHQHIALEVVNFGRRSAGTTVFKLDRDCFEFSASVTRSSPLAASRAPKILHYIPETAADEALGPLLQALQISTWSQIIVVHCWQLCVANELWQCFFNLREQPAHEAKVGFIHRRLLSRLRRCCNLQ